MLQNVLPHTTRWTQHIILTEDSPWYSNCFMLKPYYHKLSSVCCLYFSSLMTHTIYTELIYIPPTFFTSNLFIYIVMRFGKPAIVFSHCLQSIVFFMTNTLTNKLCQHQWPNFPPRITFIFQYGFVEVGWERVVAL